MGKFTNLEIEEILKTLPTGYYLGYKFEVVFSDTQEKSKIDYKHNTLIISKKELKSQLLLIKSSDPVAALRTAFYHLIAHILLTPTGIFLNKKTYLHTFEDERVESLLKNYFLGINFKEAVKQQSKRDFARFDAVWYSIIRLRKGPKKFVDQVHEIIRKYPTIHKKQLYENYLIDVENLYHQVYGWWKVNYKPAVIPVEKGTSLTYSIELNESVIDQILSDLEKESSNQDGPFIQETDKAEKTESETLSTQSTQALKNLIANNAGGCSINEKKPQQQSLRGLPYKIKKSSLTLYDKLRYFIEQPLRESGKKSAAIPSYSGTFCPRNCDRDDYKYFSVPNFLGNSKKFKDKHLNLFLDCSGSFTGSEEVNGILEVLNKIEKRYPIFSYSVILCSEKETVMPRNNRLHYSGYNGYGTRLTPEIFDIYNKVQKRNAQNINIAMYDGYCDTYCKVGKYTNTFQAFNHPNVTLIIESSNEKQVTESCPLAYKLVVDEKELTDAGSSQYVKKIEENIVLAFALLFS